MEHAVNDRNLFHSESHRIETGCGYLYLHAINKGEKGLEILVNLGKSGVCPMAFLSSYASLLSVLIPKVNKALLLEALNSAAGRSCGSKPTCIDQFVRHIFDILNGEVDTDIITFTFEEEEEE